MSKINNTLVIIPARGGSKRIVNKNIKEIYGQPMLYWPLMELSKIFYADNVIVSTDSEEIISKVEKIGLKVPFKRPKELSDDYTGTVPVANHALNWYETRFNSVDYVIIVYPTAVMLSTEDIKSALKTLKLDPNCDSVMSAAHFPFPIQRAVFNNKSGYAEMFRPEHYSTRSQDLVEAIHDAGQFYVCRSHSIRAGKTLINSNVKLHLLHKSKVIDIDTVKDFEIAEEKLSLAQPSFHRYKWAFQSEK